ncbi:MAG: hypothetical protein AAFN77_02015 [Planctomycetota bacterium]
MKQRSFLIAASLSLIFVFAGTALAIRFQDTGQKKVPVIKRVKRPVFKEKDWDGIYFGDLFKEGLVGPRPEKLAPGQLPQNPTQVAGNSTQTKEAASTPAGGFAWSKVISASSIEDEVKALQQTLAADITTPSKFKSDYAKVHQSFSMLSMLFAVVREYDDDVRWKKFSGPAQASFEKAAANSRVGTIQAYESCKRRSADLQEMVRGGNFAGTEKAPEELDWSAVVGHSPIMKQMEVSYGELKQKTANEKEFTGNLSDVLRHAELVALMSRAVQLENMEYAEEDGYVDYAKSMFEAANKVSQGCRTNDFAAVSKNVNLIGQTCSNCHDDWR